MVTKRSLDHAENVYRGKTIANPVRCSLVDGVWPRRSRSCDGPSPPAQVQESTVLLTGVGYTVVARLTAGWTRISVV